MGDKSSLKCLEKSKPCEKEKNIFTDDDIAKISVLNLTKENFEEKFSSYIFYCEYKEKEDRFSQEREEVLLFTDFLFVLFDRKKVLKNQKIKELILEAKEKNIDVYFYNINKEKPFELCNEISNLISEPALINVLTSDIKNFKFSDYFIIEKTDENFKENLQKELKKHIRKIKNLKQIAISITAGYDVELDEVYECIDMIKLQIPNKTEIIFGVNMKEDYSGVYKIAVIFQSEKIVKNWRKYGKLCRIC